ncbi:LigA protein [Micromonospora sp. M42]|nr:LigA protein [Micromonospora sp. M42]
MSRTELIQKSATVDDRVADLRAETLPATVRESLDGVRKLDDVRTATLAGRARPDQILTAFSEVDTALIDALRLPYQVDTDTAAGRQVLALDALLRVDEALSSCTTQIVLVKATGDPRMSRSFVACMAALNVDNRRFRRLITPEQLKVAELDDAAVAARTSPTFLVDSLRDPDAAIAPVSLDVLFPASRSMITLGQFVEKKVVADVIAETRAREREALTAAWLVTVAAGVILLVVVLLSMTVARTVARPLSRLTRSAERVARVAEAELTRVADDESESVPPVRLDPVEVSARDEIGELARAFDRVQHTAARLVERQVAGRRNVAQMFGHVGRRTQNLVGRQIALIDRLERQETDPGRLEHLYRLDHISSRLRRNAGSLVVLSGATGSDGHVAPVPLADVVRLALGEIEDYTRVDVEVPPGVAAAPAIVGDLVLTLAELMENATSFSAPHTRVVVTGELTDGGARLVVVDHGIGLTEERMAEENARFDRRERLDLAPTEVLGLFVVGRLARRHGWHVRLTPTPGGGVTATLEVPADSLVVRRPEPVFATATLARCAARRARARDGSGRTARRLRRGAAEPGHPQHVQRRPVERLRQAGRRSGAGRGSGPAHRRRAARLAAGRRCARHPAGRAGGAPRPYLPADTGRRPGPGRSPGRRADDRPDPHRAGRPSPDPTGGSGPDAARRPGPRTGRRGRPGRRAVVATGCPAGAHADRRVRARTDRRTGVGPAGRSGPHGTPRRWSPVGPGRAGTGRPAHRTARHAVADPAAGARREPPGPRAHHPGRPGDRRAADRRTGRSGLRPGPGRGVPGRRTPGRGPHHPRPARNGASPAEPAGAGREPGRHPGPVHAPGQLRPRRPRRGPQSRQRIRGGRRPRSARSQPRPSLRRGPITVTSPFLHDNIEQSAAGDLSPEARTFNWLLDSFTSSTAGVMEAIAVSSDGLLMAMSAIKDRSNAERLAAVVSGMTSLAGGAASWYALGALNRVIVDMAEGYLLISAISSGSVLGVVADRTANLGTVAYEMTLFAGRAGGALSPRLIAELKNAVQQ